MVNRTIRTRPIQFAMFLLIFMISSFAYSASEEFDSTHCNEKSKIDMAWQDTSYILNNPSIVDPSIGAGLCQIIENCTPDDIRRFNAMQLPLNKNGGDFELTIDASGRYHHATTYGIVAYPEFDIYFPKTLKFKSRFNSTELHGLYQIDSNENVTFFKIYYQSFPIKLPPLTIRRKPDSTAFISNRSLESIEKTLKNDSTRILRIHDAFSKSIAVSRFNIALSINPLGKIYVIKIADSPGGCHALSYQYLKEIQNLNFGIDSSGVQNVIAKIQLESKQISAVQVQFITDLAMKNLVP